jgi:ATP/maltotriose-dependent transcriptional regulator MalT
VKPLISKFEQQPFDDRSLAKAWLLLAWAFDVGCEHENARHAAERALHHALQAEDPRGESESIGLVAAAVCWGPMPVPDALRFLDRLFDAHPDSKAEADIGLVRSVLLAMNGDIDDARTICERSKETLADLGLRTQLAAVGHYSGLVERLAGDLRAAELHLREGFDILSGLGERNFLSTTAGLLARILCERERYDEAEGYAQIAEREAASDDVISQVLWRGARARVLAHRGDLELSGRLARDAARLASKTDGLNMRADALLDLAAILVHTGSRDEAQSVVNESRRLLLAKGNLVAARQAEATFA